MENRPLKVKQIILTLPFRTTMDLEKLVGYSHFRVGGCDVTDSDTGKPLGGSSGALTGGLFIHREGDDEFYLDPRDIWAAFSEFLENSQPEIVDDPYNNLSTVKHVLDEEPEPSTALPEEPTEAPIELEEKPPEERSRVVYLEIKSWVGTSAIGASHWYGELVCGNRRQNVERILTSSMAGKLNKQERRMGRDEYAHWKEGDVCDAFLDLEAVIAQAKKMWKDTYPWADILVEGRSVIASPQRILEGPVDIMGQVNSWYEEAEALGWYEGDKEAMEDISNEFWTYWTKVIDDGRN